MNYCILMQNIFTLGGIQKVVENYANELVNQGNRVTIIMPFLKNIDIKVTNINPKIELIDYKNFESNKYVTFIKNKLYNFNNKYNFYEKIFSIKFLNNFFYPKKVRKRLVNFIQNKKFEVVIAAGGIYWSNLLGSFSNQINSVSIGWQHSTFDLYFLAKGKANYGFKKLSYLNYRNLDDIWVLTKKDKGKFDSFLKRNTKVCYNPINIVEDKSLRNNKNVLFLGRLVKSVKGLNYLVEIINKTIQYDKDIHFYIVGDGPDKKWLIDEISKNNLTNNVSFYETTSNVYKYYLNSSLLIQTSTSEGFGMTILEAMSCGVPSISFHNDGPDEIINDSVNGFLINKYDTNDFAKKIINLLNDKKQLQKISNSAYNKSKMYDVKDFIIYTNNLIKNIKK